MKHPFSGTLLLPLVLAGCVSLAPDRPATPTVTPSGSFIGANGESIASEVIPSRWWRFFDEDELNSLVEHALAANADLRVALANLEASRASLRLARSAQTPATVLESGAGPERADQQPSTSSVPKTSYELGATIAYEVDLFGRLRNAANAALADFDASIAARDAVRLAVIGDTVSAYIDYCSAVRTEALAKEQVTTQQHSVLLVATQLGEGEVSQLEHSQASAALERARSALAPLQADQRRARYRLATLQGMPPTADDAQPMRCTNVPRMTRPLPVGDSAALLARRPDVREAEHRLAAATARIGVATADLYPRISLGGSGGRIGGGWDAILTPLVTWSFPNQTAARARLAAARSNTAAALAGFDAAILRALREVETTLADYEAERARLVSLAAALSESDKARRRAEARFRLGADSYLLVLDAERTHTDLTLLQAASEARIAQLQVLLFRALGGGWDADHGKEAQLTSTD